MDSRSSSSTLVLNSKVTQNRPLIDHDVLFRKVVGVYIGSPSDYQYFIPLSSSLCSIIYTQNNYIARGPVCRDNNIFVLEMRQVFSNIRVFKH